MSANFWEHKSLDELSKEEWESLCDGCGRCCLNKLEDIETNDIAWTNVACELLDCETCQCTDYGNRFSRVADCLPLSPETVGTAGWLPPTCAYRRISEKKPLYDWHPLITGDRLSVHHAGISVRGKVVSETHVLDEDLEDYVVIWPETDFLEQK